jgi:ABC-type nitrate/sulfonate/bicarbonate transport system substrate-binding protein
MAAHLEASQLSRRVALKIGLATGAGAMTSGPLSIGVNAQRRPTIKLVMSAAPPDPAFHFYYYALENGFYEQEGFKIEMQAIPVETNALRAVASGDMDAGNPGTVTTIKAIRGGGKIRIVGSFWSADYLIVAKKEIPDLKALEGRTMAVSGVGAAVHTFSVLMMQKRGADPNKVQWVAPGSSASRMQALVAGRTDAAILSSTFTAQAMKQPGRFHAIADSTADMPNYPWCCEIVRQDVAASKPDLAQGLITALSRAVRWMYRNPADAVLISQKLLPDTPKDALAATVQRLIEKRIVNETGMITRERFDGLVEWLASTNQLDQPVRFEDAVSTRFIDGALRKLGPGTNA